MTIENEPIQDIEDEINDFINKTLSDFLSDKYIQDVLPEILAHIKQDTNDAKKLTYKKYVDDVKQLYNDMLEQYPKVSKQDRRDTIWLVIQGNDQVIEMLDEFRDYHIQQQIYKRMIKSILDILNSQNQGQRLSFAKVNDHIYDMKVRIVDAQDKIFDPHSLNLMANETYYQNKVYNITWDHLIQNPRDDIDFFKFKRFVISEEKYGRVEIVDRYYLLAHGPEKRGCYDLNLTYTYTNFLNNNGEEMQYDTTFKLGVGNENINP